MAPKFYGPYEIIEKVGKVAYMLNLPPSAAIHPVFHASLLKKKVSNQISPLSTLPPVNMMGQFEVEPVAILVKQNNQAAVQVLVQWDNMTEEEAIWEDYDSFFSSFPNFTP